MDFRELTYVMAIAEHQTISDAAKALYIAQPSLSRFLINLEEELQLQLFERINKKMSLTFAGQRYIETAQHIIALRAELNNELSEIARVRRGNLRIGTTQTHGKYILPRCLSMFKRKYPEFHITLHEGGVNVMEKYLRDGLVDLSIYTAADAIKNEEFTCHYVNSEEIVLALPKSERFRSMGVKKPGFRYPWIDISQLGDVTFLMMPNNWRVGSVGRTMIAQAGIEPDIIIFSTLETAVSSAAYGVGGCFVSDMCDKYFESAVQPDYYSIGSAPQLVEFFVAQRKSTNLTKAQRDFIEMIRSHFGEYPYEYKA